MHPPTRLIRVYQGDSAVQDLLDARTNLVQPGGLDLWLGADDVMANTGKEPMGNDRTSLKIKLKARLVDLMDLRRHACQCMRTYSLGPRS